MPQILDSLVQKPCAVFPFMDISTTGPRPVFRVRLSAVHANLPLYAYPVILVTFSTVKYALPTVLLAILATQKQPSVNPVLTTVLLVII